MSPNPAGDVLNITMSNASILSVDIIAGDGRVVMNDMGANALDVSALPAAVYSVRTTLAGGSVVHANFVKR